MKHISNNTIVQYIEAHPFYTLGIVVVVWFIIFTLYNTYLRSTSQVYVPDPVVAHEVLTMRYEKVIFAGGCFWCTESEFNHLPGVISAISGYTDVKGVYAGGEGPRYQDVVTGQVIAREAVEITYDPKKVSFDMLLEKYFRHIDPTDNRGQFADKGYQYTPAVYYVSALQFDAAKSLIAKIDQSDKFDKKVTVEVLPFENFYPAEEYHQDYKDKNKVRYEVYREGSGRNSYTRNNWADESPLVKEIFNERKKDMDIYTTQPTSTSAVKVNWKNFTKEMKDESVKKLTSLQYGVTQKEGTEKPFSNEYDKNNASGIYVDIVSGEPLFFSGDKFDSGTGWPSFVKPVDETAVALKEDKSLFSFRTEVRSKIADSHLGHVFPDGPKERGGMRYCMNSAALRFIPLTEMEKEGYGEYVGSVK